MQRGAERVPKGKVVPPTKVLLVDLDLIVDKSWLEEYRRKVRLVLRSYGLSPTAIRITASRSKGYHVMIYLNKPVPAQTANLLRLLLCDDPRRVDFNSARINAGFDEWCKLFEDPRL